MVPTDTKRLWLRRAYAQTTAGGGTTYATLSAALNAYGFAASDAVKAGTIASSSINGHAVSFSNRANGATPEDVASAWSQLLDLYDSTRAALVAAGDASPTDEEIKDEMLDWLQTVREYQPSYTTVLCG